MAVDETTVRRVAHLARIAVKDEEVAHLTGELNAILGFVEELSALDVEGVEPLTSVMPMKLPVREDLAPVRTAMTSVSPRRAAAVTEKPADPV